MKSQENSLFFTFLLFLLKQTKLFLPAMKHATAATIKKKNFPISAGWLFRGFGWKVYKTSPGLPGDRMLRAVWTDGSAGVDRYL